MRVCVCLSTALLLATTSVRAATTWERSGAKIDETIADTTDTTARAMVQPLLTAVPFSSFRYPHVDAEENVTFIADDPVYGNAAHHGIYRSEARSGELRALVSAGETQVPGLPARFDFIRGLQVDGADFVFNATDDADGRGLYHWSKGRLRLIARTGGRVAGVNAALRDVEYGALAAGRILYNARTDSQNLLLLHELATGETRVLCRSGIGIPGRTGEQFRYFSPQDWLDAANIVFRGASVDDPHRKEFATSGRRGVYAWLGIDWSNAKQVLEATRLITIADARTPVPLLPGRRFTDFRSAPVRNGLVAFRASGPGFAGVYFVDLREPTVVKAIVDTESALPGVFEGNFTSFGTFCPVFEKSVVFIGRADEDHYLGVFLYRADRDELFLLCDNRTNIGPDKPGDLEIAADFLVRDRFAITARFADGTSGVYLATIPADSFRRISH